jgi:hypothetical protein
MKKLLALALALTIVTGTTIGCAGNRPPVVSPQVAQSLTNGLAALAGILSHQSNVNPAVLVAISEAQAALAADIAGQNYGQIVRTCLEKLYSLLPESVLTQYWYVFAALEVGLATVGA